MSIAPVWPLRYNLFVLVNQDEVIQRIASFDVTVCFDHTNHLLEENVVDIVDLTLSE